VIDMAEFHAGMFSPKETETLLKDMHWNAKKLMRQSAVTHDLVQDIKTGLKKFMNKKTEAVEKEELRKELVPLLEKLEYFYLLEEKTEFLDVKESAEVEKRTLIDMRKHIREEISKLLGSRSIPRSYKDAILQKVRKDMKKEKKDINKQAEIALEVKRGSASATLQTLKIMAPSERAAARRQKRYTYKGEKELDLIDDIKDKLKKHESEHDIDDVKKDLIEEAHDDEKEIHYVYTNLLYCLLFMSYMDKEFGRLNALIKKGKRRPDVKEFTEELARKIDRLRGEWNLYTGKIVKVLQQLRFSVVSAEEAKILAKSVA
jgi:hypothetical protein